MSIEYAQQRIKEALRQNKGHTGKAQKQIIAWARQDSRLLLALTQHHLNGIAAYHIERVAAGRGVPKPETPLDGFVSAQKPANSAADVPSSTKPRKQDSFGMEVLKAVVRDDPTIFGMEAYSTPPKRGQASQRHINAIHQIATQTIRKRGSF